MIGVATHVGQVSHPVGDVFLTRWGRLQAILFSSDVRYSFVTSGGGIRRGGGRRRFDA